MTIATDNERSGASVPGSGTGRWETLKHEFMQIWQVLAALLLIYLVFLVLSPPFRSVDTLLSIFGQASILAILACGTTVVLISGGLDLSVGSIFAVVGIVVGILLAEYQLPVAVAVLLGLLTGTLLGAVNGIVQVVTGVPAFIVTLGGLTAYKGIAELLASGRDLSRFPRLLSTARLRLSLSHGHHVRGRFADRSFPDQDPSRQSCFRDRRQRRGGAFVRSESRP